MNKVTQQVREKTVIMDSYAWAWYNNALSLGGVYPRAMVPLFKLYEIAIRLGRPLSLGELQVMIQKYGTSQAVCWNCGNVYQPVKFVLVDDAFLMAVYQSKDVILECQQSVLWAGNYYPNLGEVVSACGPYYYFGYHKENGEEFYVPNQRSCAGQALIKFKQVGLVYEDCNREVVRLARERKAMECPVVKNKPVSPKVELVIKDTDHGLVYVQQVQHPGKLTYGEKVRIRRIHEAQVA